MNRISVLARQNPNTCDMYDLLETLEKRALGRIAKLADPIGSWTYDQLHSTSFLK
jgi:hypothetical protein